ncbi:L-seryl-tRNA(Sec) selenium transferase [Sulfitobacter sp. M57]|uniref:L-seryl-tRNA(Sec) selenium transferase n=1 Tax=unclassified Sulfitobacter TaxID=196795 RepID=UPI0023E1F3EA|nr:MULTISPECIES: L-seryl-tRNA(Sec) selenium transferase [unclassified Sulfitobacter]MDF3413228.1 L-seryl-tRNA(Sec) selenium transferase [Sulfitobacter sp. KE5]MDF3421489.1 L-seryl-tRNA(Sec) selenium transferase [Sulfitobacter sp. KE43]MDF3431777.1 L-seryl-tRNA(Sec) selenium transferase [Sulfitobacter sp. KE42]MDF3457417.1 L-seryl-tRNA(Sec) selenium transferase [Sulfitobacter sp. S74]MDF3461320.1 L-seryl-tRNA(Sec) selenium transferase [Sulfitobacter sp. Ks18]
MQKDLSKLPQIQTLLEQPAISEVMARYSHEETVTALRGVIADLRAGLLAGHTVTFPDFASAGFAAHLSAQIEAERSSSLHPVINATGILIHTNLGRARMAPQAVAAMQAVGATPSNLELDLETGKRGSRHAHVETLICELTGAEAAVVVNNCAAAVLLGLMATAGGRSVVASRGELIEIGGSFRLPDVIAQSGATLREVGTTNKTRVDDYANAIDGDTAVLLKSHTSNFKIVGFTAAPERRDLARLAKERDVILIEDLGSGVLIDLSPYGLPDEPVVADILKAGVNLVMFSGDKLLGGPQAGIIAGRSDIVAQLKGHPLMRALRVDKLSLAALEATLRLYRPPHDPLTSVPVLQMLSAPLDQIETRARALEQSLGSIDGARVAVHETAAYVGGGSLPDQALASFAVSLRLHGLSAEKLAAALRQHETPVIGRIEQDQVMLDMRTVWDGELATIAQTVQRIAAR